MLKLNRKSKPKNRPANRNELGVTEQRQKKTEQVVVATQSRLLAFIRRRVRELEDAEDILQSVFCQLSIADIIWQPLEEVKAWLYTVARNRIIDLSRKKREQPLPGSFTENSGQEPDLLEALFLPPATSPEEEYLRLIFWMELETALAELPPEQREIFVQTEIYGYSFRELAEQSGVNQNTLLARKRYAVQYLRKRLAMLFEDLVGV